MKGGAPGRSNLGNRVENTKGAKRVLGDQVESFSGLVLVIVLCPGEPLTNEKDDE